MLPYDRCGSEPEVALRLTIRSDPRHSGVQRNRRAVEQSVQKMCCRLCRIKKTLIARCMIGKSRRTRISRFEGHIMRNIASVVGVVAVSAATFFSPAPATAENGQIAAGVVGGLIGGALLGGALASRPAPPPPVYYSPAPVYVEEPVCRFVRERYWDGYGWVYRRVQVCD
jgi:hypothetical protein